MNAPHPRSFVFAVILGALLALGVTASVAAVDPADDPGSPVARTRVTSIHALFADVFNSGDLTHATSLAGEQARFQTPFGTFTGADGLLEYIDLVRLLYPDAEYHVIGVTGEGDIFEVAWRMTASVIQMDAFGEVGPARIDRVGTATIVFSGAAISGMSLDDGTAVTAQDTDAVPAVGVPESLG